MKQQEPPVCQQTIQDLYAVLQTMKTANGFVWDASNTHVYEMRFAAVLAGRPDSVVRWVIGEINRRFTWRPEPAEVGALMDAYMSEGVPSAAEALATLRWLYDGPNGHGQNSRPKPGCPNIFLPGPNPALADYPLIERALNALGGWPYLATCEDVHLVAHFTRAYEGVVLAHKTNTQSGQTFLPAPVANALATSNGLPTASNIFLESACNNIFLEGA